jgi:hypothetical protein
MDVKLDLSELQELEQRLERFNGSHDIPMNELLNPEFMLKYTHFSSFQDMLDHSGYSGKTEEDIEVIPGAQWDAFTSANSTFMSWDEMLEAALGEWSKRQLGF